MLDARDILAHLQELAELTILDEGDPQSFRARAYQRAVEALRAASGDIARMSATELAALSGVGKSTAKKVRELVTSGRLAKLDELRARYPPEYVRLSHIPGLGPKTLARLRAELDVQSVADLKRALDAHALRELEGLGAKSEEKIRHALERLDLGGKEHRTPIVQAMAVAERICDELAGVREVDAVDYCGSLRRQRESVADVDVLAASSRPEVVMRRFASLPLVGEVLVRGDTKTSIVTRAGLQVDLRVVPRAAYGAALLYFTGSKAHNIKLRQLALKRGRTLNEYALCEVATGAVVAAETEVAIYQALGLPFIPPPMREDTGEIDAGLAGSLPAWVEEDQLRGDLHVHTTLSGDGRSPLAEVVQAARDRGLEYLGLTEHAENLAMNGVSRAALDGRRRELEALQPTVADIRLLHGAELNIGPDGSLDYDLDFRLGLDWCVAAVHSHFDLDRDAQTRRIIAAMRDPSVHVIGHLTGRKLGRRPGVELDVDAVLDAAAATGTALEINASLSRLDVAVDVLRRGRDRDVAFVISTDTHHTGEFRRATWGVRQAQRGWLPPDRIVNTRPYAEFLAWADACRAGKRAA